MVHLDESVTDQPTLPRSGRRRVLTVLLVPIVFAVLVGAYVGYKYVNQRNAIYQVPPTNDRLTTTAKPLVMTESGQMLGWIVNPGKNKAILYFGGNGEDVGALQNDFAELFPERTVYLMPYPGFPPNPGSISEKNLVDAANKLYDAVSPRHSDIGLAGRSLGAAVAMQVVRTRTVDRMLLVTPFHRLDDAMPQVVPFFSNRKAMKDHFDSLSIAPQVKVPTVIVTADNDTNVPFASSQLLINAFGVRPAVVAIPNANHGNVTGGDGYRAAARGAFEENILDNR